MPSSRSDTSIPLGTIVQVIVAVLLYVGALLALLSPLIAGAAVPNEDAKPAYAEEQTVLQAEKDRPEPGWTSAASGRRHFDRHYIIQPGFMPEQDVVLQRGGNTWRNWRNGPLATIAGFVLLVMPLLIFGFWQAVGPITTNTPDTGRRIRRFTTWERTVHWSVAITFLILAVTGLIVLFGKKLLLPLLGHDLFSWLAVAAKYLHNFVGPLFIVASLLLFLTFLHRNFFRPWDWQWMKNLLHGRAHEHVPAGFFNAGEKVWFWGGLTLLGMLMAVTGLLLDFPYFKGVGDNAGLTRYLLQAANVLHLLGATAYIAGAMGHIYIGTIGTPGAYEAMRHGSVDESWARAHHELWYNDVLAHGHYDAPPMPPEAGPQGA